MMKQIGCRVPEDLLEQIDRVRADVPRERWIRRTLQREVERHDSNQRAIAGVEAVTQQGPPLANGAVSEVTVTCPTCDKFGPPRTRPCAKCGQQAA